MKTQIILTTLILMSIIFNACDDVSSIIPDDNVTTQQYSYSDYDQIDTESAFTVYVEFSNTEETIEIEANDNLHQYMDVKVESGALKIRFRDNINIKGSATLNAYITTKNVSGYSASGASHFIIGDDVESENANIFLSGASKFTGEMHVANLSADLSDASVLELSGEAEAFNLTASGASAIGDYGFSTENLNINLSGASNASMTITEKMDVQASGASVLRYKGPADINSQNLTGGSQIIKTD